jgi:hypothetical protein
MIRTLLFTAGGFVLGYLITSLKLWPWVFLLLFACWACSSSRRDGDGSTPRS